MRKIAILILLALALLVAIFLPLLAEAVNVNAEAVESVKPFKIRLFAFLFLSTAFTSLFIPNHSLSILTTLYMIDNLMSIFLFITKIFYKNEYIS